MRLTLVFAWVFFAGALYNFFKHNPNNRIGITGVAIASILFGIYFFIEEQKRLRNNFYMWLFENVHAVSSGGAMYNGTLITLQTEITQYQAALSFLLITIKAPSRIYIVGIDSSAAVASLFTFISLVFGWWGIPWGPIYTIQAVLKNMRGGTRQKIGEMFEQIRAAIPSEV